MDGLRFNVAGLLKESAGATRDYDVDVAPGELAGLLEGGQPVAPLRGHLRMLRTPRSIFVRGRLRTRVAMECSRCLTDTEVALSFDLEDEYFPAIDVVSGHPLPRPEDDGMGFMIDANHELDLGESVRQHLLLELPMQTICRETCAGLCPRCGVDLNTGECTCSDDVIDERLAPLRALFEGRQ
jgi:uncharacterized protein